MSFDHHYHEDINLNLLDFYKDKENIDVNSKSISNSNSGKLLTSTLSMHSRSPLANITNISSLQPPLKSKPFSSSLPNITYKTYDPFSQLNLLDDYSLNMISLLHDYGDESLNYHNFVNIWRSFSKPYSSFKQFPSQSPSLNNRVSLPIKKYTLLKQNPYEAPYIPDLSCSLKFTSSPDPFIEVNNVIQLFKRTQSRYIVLLHQYVESKCISMILMKYNIPQELIAHAEITQSESRDYRVKNIIITLTNTDSVDLIYRNTHHKTTISFINYYEYLRLKTISVYKPAVVNNTIYNCSTDGILKITITPAHINIVKSKSTHFPNTPNCKTSSSLNPKTVYLLETLIAHLSMFGAIDNCFLLSSSGRSHLELYVCYKDINKPPQIVGRDDLVHPLFDDYTIEYGLISATLVNSLMEVLDMPILESPDERETAKMDKPQDDNRISFDKIMKGEDKRTTCMLRNIPNKYTQSMLIDFLNETHYQRYDFVYLRMDFRNKCNVGYAFINFIDIKWLAEFAKRVKGHIWECFNTSKICDITYANIQGKDALIRKFKNSSVMQASPEYRPVMFYSAGINCGKEEPFPSPDRIARS